MGEDIYPRAAEWLQPALRNFVDNPVTVQFVHRWLAFVAAAIIGLLALQAWQRGDKLQGGVLAMTVLIQIQLGILTILTGVELWIGVAHQGMAAVLLAALIVTAHRLGQSRETVAP
jgi:cytochrome c oxidase assembly protein subunit 15